MDFSDSKPKNYFTEYTEKVLSLSESIKDVLMDSSTAEFIEEGLGLSFNLTRGQITELTRIIRDILLGDAPLNSMSDLISSKLNLGQNASIQIANKIANDLLSSAIEDIKKLQTARTPERADRPTMPPQPQIPKPSEKPDLKIGPDINRNNIVDLRNK